MEREPPVIISEAPTPIAAGAKLVPHHPAPPLTRLPHNENHAQIARPASVRH